MKSPIRAPHRYNSLSILKQKLPKRSVVDSFLLYDASIELALAKQQHLMVMHTTSYPLYEFWFTLGDAHAAIVALMERLYPVNSSILFQVLQNSWTEQEPLEVRSALFFLLNRCSATGLLSSGELDNKNFSPTSLTHLRNVDLRNTHFVYDQHENFVDSVAPTHSESILFIPGGQYNPTPFMEAAGLGPEETWVNHPHLRDKLMGLTGARWVLVYMYSRAVVDAYSSCSLVLVDQYGLVTDDPKEAKEVVIANF